MGFFLTQLVFIFQNGKVKMLSLVEPATFACMTAVSSPPDRKKKKTHAQIQHSLMKYTRNT